MPALAAELARFDPAVTGEHLTCEVDRDELPGVLGLLAGAGATDVSVTPATLESLFLRHYEVAAR